MYFHYFYESLRLRIFTRDTICFQSTVFPSTESDITHVKSFIKSVSTPSSDSLYRIKEQDDRLLPTKCINAKIACFKLQLKVR